MLQKNNEIKCEDNQKMSKRDVENYYNSICKDYHELLEALREIEELVSKDIVSPDKIDNIQNMLTPMKQNYERWSYMMYLLNKPVNKKKDSWYEKTEGKKLKSKIKEDMLVKMREEDKDTIENLKNSFKEP